MSKAPQRSHQYDVLKKCGQGSYGIVYKAQNPVTRQIVAIKTLPSRDGGYHRTTLREVALLKQLNHVNLPRMYDIIYADVTIHIVMEFFDTDLRSYIKTMGRPGVTPQHIKSFLFQMVSGLDYIHAHGIIHRDLKTGNVLIKRDGRLCIADFGLGRRINIPLCPYTPKISTLRYKAPELLLMKNKYIYTLAVDVWSIGCIFAEMMLLDTLFTSSTELEQLIQTFRLFGTPSTSIWPDYKFMDYYHPGYPRKW
ncbi:kinase-like domain-containing protein [Gongronella butleri]|nr:kinase-like domain-containing protein [Gongronella butleri]